MAIENTNITEPITFLADKISYISYWLLSGISIAIIGWIIFRLISVGQEHKKIKILKEMNERLENIENKLSRKK